MCITTKDPNKRYNNYNNASLEELRATGVCVRRLREKVDQELLNHVVLQQSVREAKRHVGKDGCASCWCANSHPPSDRAVRRA